MPRRSTIKLNKRVVDALAVESGDAVFWDRDLAGFGVRVHATGRKIYVVQKRRRGGNPKRVSLGSYEDITVEEARKEAAEVIDRLKYGARRRFRSRRRRSRRWPTWRSVT